MTKNDKRQLIDEIAKEVFGTTRAEALADGKCVACAATNLVFKDDLSKREFAISGFCQKCQDEFFDKESE
jgi:hypothetical protein